MNTLTLLRALFIPRTLAISAAMLLCTSCANLPLPKLPAPASAPPTISCAAAPSSVIQGTASTITAVATNPGNRPLTYSYSTSAGTITGNSATATFDSMEASPGPANITCSVADDLGHTASATSQITILARPTSAPPIVACSVSPATVVAGNDATVTAAASSPSQRPLTYSYSTTAGSIAGREGTATFISKDATAGLATITCSAADDLGNSTSATSKIAVTSATGEQAFTAFTLADSVGVNIHLHFNNSPYYTQFPAVQQALVDGGIRHYRNGIDMHAGATELANAESLAQLGIRGDWIIDISDTPDMINSISAQAPGSVEYVEGANEVDKFVGPPILNFAQMIAKAVRENPATADKKIIPPSFKIGESAAAQGDLGALVDYSGLHDYYQNRPPETGPYGNQHFGCGGYGSLAYDICVSQLFAVNKPPISVETGYQSGYLDDTIIARYDARILFNHLHYSVLRTYFYELVDQGGQFYGLMTSDLKPKPAYTTLKSLTTFFKDEDFSPAGSLDFTLTGQTKNVEHTLLEKSDGTFYLAIWLAVPSADPNTPSRTYTIAPQTVTVTLNQPLNAATLYTFSDAGVLTGDPTPVQNNSLNVEVTDSITLIQLPPA